MILEDSSDPKLDSLAERTIILNEYFGLLGILGVWA